MRIGALNKLVDIIGTTKAGDGMGGFTETDTTITSSRIWAAIWPLMGREQEAAMQNNMIVSHRIRIRYRSVFRPDWRIRFGNRYFSVVSKNNPGERNEYLDLMCKEKV